MKWTCTLLRATIIRLTQPGVGLVISVVAWDPKVLSSSPVGY